MRTFAFAWSLKSSQKEYKQFIDFSCSLQVIHIVSYSPLAYTHARAYKTQRTKHELNENMESHMRGLTSSRDQEILSIRNRIIRSLGAFEATHTNARSRSLSLSALQSQALTKQTQPNQILRISGNFSAARFGAYLAGAPKSALRVCVCVHFSIPMAHRWHLSILPALCKHFCTLNIA